MARGKLGRPRLPDDERKRTITVYLGTRTVQQIEQQAAQTGLSRNQVIASVLAAHFDDGSRETPGQTESLEALGQEFLAARALHEPRRVRESRGRALR